MLLSIPERILLLNVLPPAEGNFLFLRAIRTLRESLGFSEEETADIGLVQQAPDKVSWNPEKNPVKEIAIGPVAAAYVSKSIQAAPSLREEHFDFYKRFVLEETG